MPWKHLIDDVVVALGDSYMSGEAGRWRGNVWDIANARRADTLGQRAYWDTPTGESMPGCHRSRSAEITLPGVTSVNLACAGARTTSVLSGGRFTPGIDDGVAHPVTGTQLPGQLTLLARLAARTRVRLVAMSIGGNDMGFSSIVRTCATRFLAPWPVARDCRTVPSVRARLSDSALGRVASDAAQAIVRVHATMAAAGYADADWSLIVQGYPRPLAEANRFPDTRGARGYGGGCPFRDADVRWIDDRLRVLSARLADAARQAEVTTGHRVHFMDLTDAFAGRELCARAADSVDRLPASQVTARAERVAMVRLFAPFRVDESLHPNHLGQQVLRACLAAAWNDGNARGGRCTGPADWSHADSNGLPTVRFRA
ncbi:MAG: hypothetical protein ACOYL4_07875 [Miltoncostaeaceae bacterium]